MNDVELVRNSVYFDGKFYLERYRDVNGVDASEHYIAHGGMEGRWPSAWFDPGAYWQAYPDVCYAGVNPLVHFLRFGISEGRWAGLRSAIPALADGALSPKTQWHQEAIKLISASSLFDAPWYSRTYALGGDPQAAAAHYVMLGASLGNQPSAHFDGVAYTRMHPDIGEMNPLVHYLAHGRGEGRSIGAPRVAKEIVLNDLRALAEIEPDLMTDDRLCGSLDTLPSVISTRNPILTRWRRVWKEVGPGVRHLVFVPWLVRGGADLAAINVLKSLQQRFGVNAVAMVATDHADNSAVDWLPEGSIFVRIADDESTLSNENCRVLVECLIWTLRPHSIFNVNSRACWDAMAQKGRALCRMSQLNALLFCRDFTPDGRPAGYSDTHLRPSLPFLRRVYLDTHYFRAELVTQFGLPADLCARLHYLPQPAATPKHVYRLDKSMVRPRVLWAGRFAAQKNIALLIKIIERGGGFDFDVWGGGSEEILEDLKALAACQDNLHLRGTFASLEALPLNTYSAFLFTSHYEGMPTVILNVAATGMPIVATAVGGVGEMVDAQTGWPIADRENPVPYLDALAEIVSSPSLVKEKIRAMHERVATERSVQAFEQRLFG